MPITNAERCRLKRAKNPEKYRELQRQCYIRNNGKEKSNERQIRFRLFKNECNRLMNILID